MIKLKNLSFYRGQRTIFENIDLLILPKQKIGITGKNGCGKTTLFELLLKNLSPNKGEIDMMNNLRIVYLQQEVPCTELSAIDYVIQGDEELAAIETALVKAEQNADYDAMMKLHTQLADIDGYTARARAAKLLKGLGFADDAQQSPVNSFSGGWRMRLNLAKTLMCRSDVMLLDEPTNHLDLDAIVWLEQWLKSYAGTLLIISHDRDFLDNVVDYIAHIHNHGVKVYTGNYSKFEVLRVENLARQQAEYDKLQNKMTHMMTLVERFRAKASKAKQAQSRLKAIARLPVLEEVQKDSDYRFEFFEPTKYLNPVVRLENAYAAYNENTVLERVNFQIGIGQRIGLLGPNGAGKSTLIKMLTGDLALKRGQHFLADESQIGYFAQHQFELLYKDESALDHMKSIAPNKNEKDLRSYLGGFGFSQDHSLMPIEHCSGGEKAKLILAMIIWKKPALLLLDEPTNHLDMEMRHALILALQQYKGSLIIVSHDRHLLRMATDELWLVHDKQVKVFDGDIQDYEKWFLAL